jgi:formylglycine-generating enzyme required for sulfatase activity
LEWEKAARGGLEIPAEPCGGPVKAELTLPLNQNPKPRRRYPWGDEPDPNRANYEETGIEASSPVGCLPGGASPYGCQDMSGNVWEWTRSLWGKESGRPDYGYPYDPHDGREKLEAGDEVRRVLRGGAFYDSGRNVRCAGRPWVSPVLYDGNVGFRLVVVPPL